MDRVFFTDFRQHDKIENFLYEVGGKCGKYFVKLIPGHFSINCILNDIVE